VYGLTTTEKITPLQFFLENNTVVFIRKFLKKKNSPSPVIISEAIGPSVLVDT